MGDDVKDGVTDKLVVWGEDLIEENTMDQARQTARLPIIEGHVALMPDAHWGMGATIGSVIPTKGAIIPAAVGVDIGCGMMAEKLDLTSHSLPDNLGPWHNMIRRTVPAGVGNGHDSTTAAAARWLTANPNGRLDDKQTERALRQFGSLGSGNHFIEVCLDDEDSVWVVLHSGSRGIGNILARGHIDLAKQQEQALEDPDLAYFLEGTDEFDAYIADMLWAQDYAWGNRQQMMDSIMVELIRETRAHVTDRVNCHHNFAQREFFNAGPLWITRKGAIQADKGRRGIIPGSMGDASYITRGKGNYLSWNSSSHGAGRVMSRGQAKRQYTADELTELMGDRTWDDRNAKALLDEIPLSYKRIDQVMAAQDDLVEVEHELRSVLNYKGT